MTNSLLAHPAFVLIATGLVLPWLGDSVRRLMLLVAPLLTLAMVINVPDGPVITLDYLGQALVPLEGSNLSRLFAIVFALMAFLGALYALNQARVLELSAAFVYAGSAIGVALAGDLVSLFVFWELMAIASTIVLWSAGPKARAAGLRYAAMHLLGGVLLMAGIAGEVASTGTAAFGPMDLSTLPRWLMLAGILINAAATPLSAWLPDAYPEASWSGMVFLSAFTTKAAVYVLIRGYPGADILVWIGLAMVFYGIVYAILENDMRRILAYSIVNQVGFMVTGVGIGTQMALNGAAAHAFTHIIYKALLLMSAGSVLLMTGKSKCTDLGGLFRTMPLTAVCGIIGALAISSFPLTSGFVSKSMVLEGAAQQGMTIVWLLLVAASAGVFLHAGIKFPWFVFFQKDSGLRPAEPPWNMRLAMILASALCVGLGVAPEWLYALLPAKPDYQPYTAAHVIDQLQLLLFSGLAFFLMLDLLKRTLTITLDADWLWRRLGANAAASAAGAVLGAMLAAKSRSAVAAQRVLEKLQRSNGPDGLLGRTWPTGQMALWTTVMLGAYLILGYM